MSRLRVSLRRLPVAAAVMLAPSAAAPRATFAQPSISVSPAGVNVDVPLNSPFTARFTAQAFVVDGFVTLRASSASPTLVTSIEPSSWDFTRDGETKEFVVSGTSQGVPSTFLSTVWFEYDRTSTQVIKINTMVVVRSVSGPSGPTPTPTVTPTRTPTPTPGPICADGCPVGVIPNYAAPCPPGSSVAVVRMDDEDRNNRNARSGWTGALSTGRNPSETWLRFCKVPGMAFKPLANDDDPANHYAVLRMGSGCPPGATSFAREFDNEDKNNKNWSSGEISPNHFSGSRTHLFFCLFKRGGDVMTAFPNLGLQYGVFAAPGFSRAVESGWLHTDDEDSDNRNEFYGNEAGKAIVQPLDDSWRVDENTRMHTARVTVETRPEARCAADPPSGVDAVESSFQDAGSFARNGRQIVSWEWEFGDGTTASGPGPYWKWVYAPDTLTGRLTVTDDQGETSSASCYVTAYSNEPQMRRAPPGQRRTR